jgi:hypothetical protein
MKRPTFAHWRLRLDLSDAPGGGAQGTRLNAEALGLILFESALLGVGALNALRHYQFSEASAWMSGGVVASFFILCGYVLPERGLRWRASCQKYIRNLSGLSQVGLVPMVQACLIFFVERPAM